MAFPLKDIAGQNFQPGSDYLKSVANQARKAYCGYVGLDEMVPDIVDSGTSPLAALQKEFVRSVCELPDDPVMLPPARRAPSNQGQCQNVLYRVVSIVERGGGLGTDTFPTTVYGPISIQVRPFDGNPDFNLYVLKHNGRSGGAPGNPPLEDTLTTARKNGGSGYIQSAVLADTNPPQIDCARPTLPSDRTVPSPSRDRQLPTVKIPVPDLPDIVIPVIPVPIPVLPGVRFAPTLVFDVGGINIEFSPGNVDFSFNPQINAPITINPPGFGQPALPPSVQPVGNQGGRDCCDQLLAEIAAARGQIEIVRAKSIDIQNGVEGVANVQSGTVVPLLKDIQECACPRPTRQIEGFTNLQTYTSSDPRSNMAFAQVRVLGGGDKRKTFGVPGGVPVTIAGWYAFGRDGRWGERRPLQFDSNLCLPETRLLTDFTFAVYNGLTASGTVHVEIED